MKHHGISMVMLLVTLVQFVSSSHNSFQTNRIQGRSQGIEAASSSLRRLKTGTVDISPFYIQLSPMSDALYSWQMDLIKSKIVQLLLNKLPQINSSRFGNLDDIDLAGMSSKNITEDVQTPYTVLSIEGGVATFKDDQNLPSTTYIDNVAKNVLNANLLGKISQINGLKSVTSLEVFTGTWIAPPTQPPTNPPTNLPTRQPTNDPFSQTPLEPTTNNNPVEPPSGAPNQSPSGGLNNGIVQLSSNGSDGLIAVSALIGIGAFGVLVWGGKRFLNKNQESHEPVTFEPVGNKESSVTLSFFPQSDADIEIKHNY
jgi:hypothetical protein